GGDKLTVDVDDPNNEDEIHQHVAARYICAIESVWRLMEFDTHQCYPPVTRLAVHLPGERAMIFDGGGDDEDALSREDNSGSSLLA
ncbi:hypothetical protein GcM3_174010, partial [Golovinomyces cichoracearum]